MNKTDNNQNSGDRNSGDRNSGNWNSGDRNSGYQNSGNWNSGYRNSGYQNSGNWNSGYRNSGDWNSGDWNSGDWNSGDRNSGDWNSGDRNSGYLNTDKPPLRMFNRECHGLSFCDIDFPDFFYFDLCVWVAAESMTDAEKQENPSYETTGGYLRTYGYKEAFQAAYAEADEADRAKLLALPNFDADIFYEISGIRVVTDERLARIEALERELAELKDAIHHDRNDE